MNHGEVIDVLYQCVKDSWINNYIAWKGKHSDDYIPKDVKVSWCRPSIMFSDGSQGAIKNTNVPWDGKGRMIVQVFVPVGKGEQACYTVVQPMITNLRKLSCGSLAIRRVYPSIVSGERETGLMSWMQLNLSVEFEFTEIA